MFVQGGNAPNDIHPHYLTREDVSRTNHTQTLPYPSRDILEHEQLYGNILQAFGELFEWIDEVVRKMLPVLVYICEPDMNRLHFR
jgi:hypothetical protein